MKIINTTYDRNLGRLEQAMETLNAQAKTWNVVTISRIKGPLCEEVLRQALDIAQRRHPRLNSRIVPSSNGLKFQTEGTDKIPLRVVNKLDVEEWQEVVNGEMNQAIDSNKGLLRTVLIHILNAHQVSFLITIAHHAIADALSCVQLHSEILTYCHKIRLGELNNQVVSLTPLAPIEELIPKSTQGLKGKISSLLLLLNLAFQKLWHRPKTLGLEKYVPIAQRDSQIIHRQLSQELTQNFVNRCREESITVNSALCTAMMFTVAEKLIKNKQKKLQVSCLSYLNLRKHVKPAITDENMAVLATANLDFYTVNKDTSFWQLAREAKQKLESNIKQNNIFKMILLAKPLIDFCFIYPKQIAATVSVSNVGNISIPKSYGALELEEISFVGTHALYAGVFIVHASTFQGKMLLNFVFSRPSISQETMEILVNNVMSYIVYISNSRNSPDSIDMQTENYCPV
jgi:NRPS condensation-like uncharacterized protein